MTDQDLIESTRQFFAQSSDRNIVAVYVFGSVARGTSRPSSDVDVGVLYADPPPSTLEGLPLDLQSALESRLHRPVQIVVLNRTSADLVHRVLKDGVLVHETNRSLRIKFEVRSRQVYLDMLFIRRQYRKRPARVI